MNQGDYAVYQITINGFKTLSSQDEATKTLSKHSIPGRYQCIVPVTKTAPGDISVPRLCTFWRGDSDEAHWQDGLTKALHSIGLTDITITAEPWGMLPGYPIDTMETAE